MAIKKIAVAMDVLPEIIPTDKVASNSAIVARFKKVAEALREEQKKANIKEGRMLAPYVEEFTMAHAVMMHAAEASLIDQDTGLPVLNAEGKPARGWVEKVKDKHGRESVRWNSPDGIHPYKNSNSDIFPEEELLKAYKGWIGKPLCKDHVSNSVDGIRGIIVDTYYDPKFKRVHALFALDKKNYPDLARKVEAGYATNVSMGTAVGRSVCSDCSNVATSEAEFCNHVRNRTCYGEINLDLAPIELSIVVTGADPRAKVKTVLAHLNEYHKQVEHLKSVRGADLEKVSDLEAEIETLQKRAEVAGFDFEEFFTDLDKILRNANEDDKQKAQQLIQQAFSAHKITIKDIPSQYKDKLAAHLKYIGDDALQDELFDSIAEDFKSKWLTSKVEAPVSGADNDSALSDAFTMQNKDTKGDIANGDLGSLRFEGKTGDPFGPTDQMGSTNMLAQFASINGAESVNKTISGLELKVASLKAQIDDLMAKVNTNQEISMSFNDLKKRALERKLAYPQGTDETRQYPLMGDADKIREKEDRQMDGEMLDTKAENPDMKKKEMLHRAELETRMARRADLVQKIAEKEALKDASGKVIAVVDKASGKVQDVKEMKAEDGAEDKKMGHKEAALARLALAKEAAKKKMKDKAKAKPKKKDEEEDAEEAKKAPKGKKDMKDMKKKAYPQGTEEPKKYEAMGDADKIRANDDRQMDGEMLDTKAENPDEAKKKGLQRLAGKKLSAKLVADSDRKNSTWVVSAGSEEVFKVAAVQAYGDDLMSKVASNSDLTFCDFFHDAAYGKSLMKLVRTAGPEGAAAEMDLPMAGPAADAAAEAPAAAPAAEAPAAQMPDEGALKDDIAKSVEKIEVALSEIKALVAPDEGVVDLDVATAPAPKAAAQDKNMLEAYAYLNDVANELSFLHDKLGKGDKQMVLLARQALRDAKLASFEADQTIANYALTKAAALEQDCGDMMVLDEEELAQVQDEVRESMDKHVEEDAPPHADLEEKVEDLEKKVEEMAEMMEDMEESHAKEDKGEEAKEEKEDEAEDEDKALEDKKAARKARREALLAQAAKMDLDLSSATVHKGEGQLDFGMKVSDHGDKVENQDEKHEAAMEVATKDAAGPKVKQAAEKIAKAVKAGAIAADKLDTLVLLGSLDADAVKYYRDFFGEVDGGAEFAKALTSDFKKKASADESEKIGVRYKRAYAIGLEAQEKGMINRGKASLDEYVDALVAMPEEHFNSMKNIVAQHKAPVKSLVAAPMVGLNKGDDELQKTASDNSEASWQDLAKALWGDKF